MVFNLIDCPDGTLDILHTHEALVEGQIVPNGVLHTFTHIIQHTHSNTVLFRSKKCFFYFGVLEFLERVDEKREKKKYNAAKL
jgi:hypothetical protein